MQQHGLLLSEAVAVLNDLPMMEPTFAERFCQSHGIEENRFESTVFRLILYRRTWLFVPILRFIDPNYFEADFEFIRNVGALRELKKFRNLAWDYTDHPMNHWWPRRLLRLRVSSHRMLRLVKPAFPLVTAQGLETTEPSRAAEVAVH